MKYLHSEMQIILRAAAHLFVVAPANIFLCVAKVLRTEAKAAMSEINKILSEPNDYY